MLMETHLETKNNRLISFIILCIIGLCTLLFLGNIGEVPCVFKNTFGISCPACGMTRAFINILNGDFIQAFNYNILSIPLFILLIISTAFLIYDFVTNDNVCYRVIIDKVFKKYYWLIIILLLVSMIVNIYKGI